MKGSWPPKRSKNFRIIRHEQCVRFRDPDLIRPSDARRPPKAPTQTSDARPEAKAEVRRRVRPLAALVGPPGAAKRRLGTKKRPWGE
eukprot:4588640-Pyramimonas_sp.AAC.1